VKANQTLTTEGTEKPFIGRREFVPHMGAKSVRTLFSAPEVRYTRAGKPAEFWGLSGSASVMRLSLTLA